MNKIDLQQRYSDLLEEENHPAIHELISDLDTACAWSEAPKWMNWSTTRARYMEATLAKRMPATPRHFRPAYKLSFSMGTALVLVFAMIAIASASAFTFSPQLRYVLGLTSSTNQTVYDSDYTTINQSRTINGVDIKIEATYADSASIIIGFSEHSTTKHSGIDARLRTSQGQNLPVSLGAFGGSDSSGSTVAEAWHYDATGIVGSPKQLNLVLDVAVGQQKSSFAFTVPFHVGKVVNLNGVQATSNGVTVTLEKAVIAKSGTVFIVNGLPFPDRIIPTSQLQVPGVTKTYDDPAAIMKLDRSDPHAQVFYNQSIAANAGNWTLTIKQVLPGKSMTGGSQTQKKADPSAPDTLNIKQFPLPKNSKLGTWTFNFTVK